MYSSNKKSTYLFKYGGILPAVIVTIVWLQAFIYWSDVSTREPGDIPFYVITIVSFLIISLSVFMWLKIGLKLQYVEMNDESITVFKSNETKTYNWNQIESIKKIIFTIPVSYKIKIHGEEECFLFCSTPFLPAPFHIFDTTSLGRFIKMKKNTLNI